ncbi:MAG: S41 family peptidase [Bacteroidota bacterium]
MRKLFISCLFVLFAFQLLAQKNEINDPVGNFEALWSEFDQRYANFELKNIDWYEVYKKYRPQIHENTSNEQLFDICCSMVQELSDGHVGIEADFKECGPPYSFQIEDAFAGEEDKRAFFELMEASFHQEGFSKAKHLNISEETNFQYRTSKAYGYLRIDEMTESFFLGKLNKALDEAMQAFETKEGLIIDLRFNGGGYDRAGHQIATRLIKEPRISHFKQRRIKGKEEFRKRKTVSLKPKGKYRFTKAIVILTSDYTASAAEVFLLSVKDLSHVSIVGDDTEGIFSDMYEFSLPNKWSVSLSHMQFFSADMINFEGKGIAPDYKVLNSRKDLERGNDPVFLKAIEVLRKNK